MVEELMKVSTVGFMINSCFHLSLVLGFVVLRINLGSFVLWQVSYVLVQSESCFCNYLQCYRTNHGLCILGTCFTELDPPTLFWRWQGLVIMLILPLNYFQTYMILLSQLPGTTQECHQFFVFWGGCLVLVLGLLWKYFYFSGKILKCHILMLFLQSDNQVCLKLFHITHTCIITFRYILWWIIFLTQKLRILVLYFFKV